MNIQISCPSKTFLIGEYAVLKGGPCIIANTHPRFTLKISKSNGKTTIMGIHASSPAGTFLAKNRNAFAGYHFEFLDPHRKQGGLGASSAQFLLSYVFKEWLSQQKQINHDNIALEPLLDTYIHCAWNGKGQPPSGADIIGQLQGNLTYFERDTLGSENLPWPFAELGFALVRTGTKVATHEHLKNLPSIPYPHFRKLVEKCKASLATADAQQFILSLREYKTLLQELNLTAQRTQELLKEFAAVDFIAAAKGCGALGADIIVVVYEKNQRERVNQFIEQLQLTIIATEMDLSPGISIQEES